MRPCASAARLSTLLPCATWFHAGRSAARADTARLRQAASIAHKPAAVILRFGLTALLFIAPYLSVLHLYHSL